MNILMNRIGTFLFSAFLASPVFSATIVGNYNCFTIYDYSTNCGESPEKGAPSFDLRESNWGYYYNGRITVESDPGVPILNLILRFQANPDQPNVDYHFYSSGSYAPSSNPRLLSGIQIGSSTTISGEINTWEISWGAGFSFHWWGWGNTEAKNYRTIQGASTLIVQTDNGFTELASSPIWFTGAMAVVPEPSGSALAALSCTFCAFRRRRCA